jgi:hypothetical protein
VVGIALGTIARVATVGVAGIGVAGGGVGAVALSSGRRPSPARPASSAMASGWTSANGSPLATDGVESALAGALES